MTLHNSQATKKLTGLTAGFVIMKWYNYLIKQNYRK